MMRIWASGKNEMRENAEMDFYGDSSFSKMTSEEAKHTSDGGKYNTTLWMPEVVHYFKENLQKAKGKTHIKRPRRAAISPPGPFLCSDIFPTVGKRGRIGAKLIYDQQERGKSRWKRSISQADAFGAYSIFLTQCLVYR